MAKELLNLLNPFINHMNFLDLFLVNFILWFTAVALEVYEKM